MQNVFFKNIENERVKELFEEVATRYRCLKNVKLVLLKTKIASSTMQAQPILGSMDFRFGLKAFKIKMAYYVRSSKNIEVEALPDDVLKGWFAHELGHVIDYQGRSLFGMLVFGLRYTFSDKFKQRAEYQADYIAINHGFYEEILKAKEFLFYHDMIDQKYKNKLKKFYLSIEDTQSWMQKNVMIDPIDS